MNTGRMGILILYMNFLFHFIEKQYKDYSFVSIVCVWNGSTSEYLIYFAVHTRNVLWVFEVFINIFDVLRVPYTYNFHTDSLFQLIFNISVQQCQFVQTIRDILHAELQVTALKARGFLNMAKVLIRFSDDTVMKFLTIYLEQKITCHVSKRCRKFSNSITVCIY